MRRGIAPHILGRVIEHAVVRERALRWPIVAGFEAAVRGLRVVSVDRRGKYLLLGLADADAGAGAGAGADAELGLDGTARWFVLVHLGMSGSLRLVDRADAPRKHDHVDLCFAAGHDGDHDCLRFHDPRRFGSWHLSEPPALAHPLLASLGVEPLSEGFSGEYLFERSRGRKRSVKDFLMDAKLVVGVGNIYAAEALFLARIHPFRAAGRVSLARYRRLAQEVKKVLSAAIEQGGTTLRDFVAPDSTPGYFAQTLNVYGRAGKDCAVCGQPVQVARRGQRSSFFCARCQR